MLILTLPQRNALINFFTASEINPKTAFNQIRFALATKTGTIPDAEFAFFATILAAQLKGQFISDAYMQDVLNQNPDQSALLNGLLLKAHLVVSENNYLVNPSYFKSAPRKEKYNRLLFWEMPVSIYNSGDDMLVDQSDQDDVIHVDGFMTINESDWLYMSEELIDDNKFLESLYRKLKVVEDCGGEMRSNTVEAIIHLHTFASGLPKSELIDLVSAESDAEWQLTEDQLVALDLVDIDNKNQSYQLKSTVIKSRNFGK